jgi:hypothetical protein
VANPVEDSNRVEEKTSVQRFQPSSASRSCFTQSRFRRLHRTWDQVHDAVRDAPLGASALHPGVGAMSQTSPRCSPRSRYRSLQSGLSYPSSEEAKRSLLAGMACKGLQRGADGGVLLSRGAGFDSLRARQQDLPTGNSATGSVRIRLSAGLARGGKAYGPGRPAVWDLVPSTGKSIEGVWRGCAWVASHATFWRVLQTSGVQMSDVIHSAVEATLSSWRRSFSPAGSKPEPCP